MLFIPKGADSPIAIGMDTALLLCLQSHLCNQSVRALIFGCFWGAAEELNSLSSWT